MKPTLALTIHQLWAAGILLGKKTTEFRSWRPREVPLELFLHVGKGKAGVPSPWPDLPEDLDAIAPKGHLIATMRIALVDEPAEEGGPLQWRVEDVRPLVRPVLATGKLMLWPVPEAVRAQCLVVGRT